MVVIVRCMRPQGILEEGVVTLTGRLRPGEVLLESWSGWERYAGGTAQPVQRHEASREMQVITGAQGALESQTRIR